MRKIIVSFLAAALLLTGCSQQTQPKSVEFEDIANQMVRYSFGYGYSEDVSLPQSVLDSISMNYLGNAFDIEYKLRLVINKQEDGMYQCFGYAYATLKGSSSVLDMVIYISFRSSEDKQTIDSVKVERLDEMF